MNSRAEESIQEVNLTQIDEANFKQRYADSVILTHDHKILLQRRGDNWNTFPGFISTFGGRIELNESPVQALMRELKEELGAEVKISDVISLGAVTEKITGHNELVYVYFWHDQYATITGCYEGEAKYFDNVEVVFTEPKMMDYVRWALTECQKRQLL